VASALQVATPENMAFVTDQFESLKIEGEQSLAKENIPEDKRQYELVIDMRFKGQNYEIPIPVFWDELAHDGFSHILNRFHVQHEKIYGYARKDGIVEFVNYRLTAVGELPKATFEKSPETKEEAKPIAIRQVFFAEIEEPGYYDTKIFLRQDLQTGHTVCGPVIVEQMDTTILVLPEQMMKVDEFGNLIIYTFGEEE
jgi:N-methylhydantoinase A